eukprot:GHVU01135613.1.p1 GENE.GHVU01135613.1~~GHVU01135613.1.p1  ORF type:complete len:198 (+),score=23.85 GHVU01135613.1:241-834(+)
MTSGAAADPSSDEITNDVAADQAHDGGPSFVQHGTGRIINRDRMDEIGNALKQAFAAVDLQQESGDTVQGLLPSDEVDRWADFDVAPEPDDTDLVFVGPLNMQSDPRPSFSEILERYGPSFIRDALQDMQSKHDATAIKVMQHAIRSANALASFAGYVRYYLEFDPGLIEHYRHLGKQQRVSLIRRKPSLSKQSQRM